MPRTDSSSLIANNCLLCRVRKSKKAYARPLCVAERKAQAGRSRAMQGMLKKPSGHDPAITNPATLIAAEDAGVGAGESVALLLH